MVFSSFSAALFLSTPSARRATGVTPPAAVAAVNFYPRPPRGGRPGFCLLACRLRNISIHALREEGDSDVGVPATWAAIFLSTPSARRATASPCGAGRQTPYFYPRPPRGGRPCAKIPAAIT